MVVILGVLVFIAANAYLLTTGGRERTSHSFLPYRIAFSLMAPFQEVATRWIRFNENIWKNYFYLVAAAQENRQLKQALADAKTRLNQHEELTLANQRLRRLLDFKETTNREVVAAEVVGMDPSPWFKTVVINKGKADGVEKGCPVVMAEGIVGQVIEVSKNFAKVLLMIDQNSAIDAILQRSRARGIIKGGTESQCLFDYLLRKHNVNVGDTLITSGLDGVYPKGLPIGKVTSVNRPPAGIFQKVTVAPFVDFEKLEEVVVMLPPPMHDMERGR